ncbi:unnamed protein product [Schistocephalus solidus]|uniref:BACK domain-containing protein n=1 Tax=Schistocephalus solidus TaxID=70667 RepID=A0A183T1T3_SCHSO|nr:unnamed protein product [Schistocephalus solidus]
MSHTEAKLFEDEFPLGRCCPALNDIRLAGEIKDLKIEVKDGALLHVHRVIMAARIPSLRPSLGALRGEENSLLSWPTVPLSVNIENLEETWEFARTWKIGQLMESCIQQMKVHFESFVYSDLFVHLPAETILKLLRSENLQIDCEEQIFGAISRWAISSNEVDEEKLMLQTPAMLKEVQWHQTTAQFRKRVLDNHPIFQCSPEFEQWIGMANADKPRCPLNQNIRMVKSPQTFFVFGKEKNQDRWSVLRLNSHMQNEERVADMELRYGASFSVVGESIFVIGGQTTQQVGTMRVDEFMVREGCWRKRSPLVIRRRDHAAAVVKVDVGDKEGGEKSLIGVFGGSFKEGGSWINLPCCEVYDVKMDRWYQLPNLRERRCGPAAVSPPGDSRVFVFGGRGDSSPTASVEFCHLRTDWREKLASENTTAFWLPAAPMKTARAFLAAAHFRGRILVAGGWDGEENLDVVEQFTPPNSVYPLGQWTTLAAMKKPDASFGILTSSDTVFVLGGDMDPKNTVETLSPVEGSLDFDNDLASWVWSSRCTVGMLKEITGAATVRL